MMRLVHISEYGKRFGFQRTFISGNGQVTAIHFPAIPSMKYALVKMLFLIKMNKFKTRREILDSYESNEFIKHICSYGNSFTPYIDHYWSDLHRYGYISQYRDGKRIIYSLTNKSEKILQSLPDNERKVMLFLN